jgi:hypothetical protein
MTTDLKTSILVNGQVPEYVRDEYPKFVAFLQAYYEFLEQKQGSEINDLATVAKNLRTIKDVDESIDSFEQSFYNTYGALIPADVQANKALLFKHLVELYRTKGAENSFKLLFQLVFGEDLEVLLPKNNVLKPSASKWTVDNKLRINTDVFSLYSGNGTQKTFVLPQQFDVDQVSVSIDGITKENLVDYVINKEYRKLIFNTAPTNGATIRVNFSDFDFKLFVNRKVTGLSSGASAIIEDANRRIISDTFNLGLPVELLVNAKSRRGTFLNGETVSIPILDANDELIEVRASSFSVIKRFTVVNSGSGYVVGDKVTVFGGNSSVNAIGTVSEIFSGTLSSIVSLVGGAVFTNTSPIVPSGNGIYAIEAFVDGIDVSGTKSANNFLVSTDIIGSFNGSIHAANTVISCTNYGFVNANIPTGENASTRLIDALSFDRLTVGPITNVKILITGVPLDVPVSLDAFGALYGPNTNYRTVKSLGSIGSFKINDGGNGYKVGDEIVFGQNPIMTFGQGGAAVVGSVNAIGSIVRVDVANARVSGTVSLSGAPPSSSLQGTGTSFTNELKVGDIIDVNGESRMVATITSDTVLSVKDIDGISSNPFNKAHSNQKLGVFNYYPKGGHGYIQNNFPTVTVSSPTGVGANIQIASIASDGEQLQPSGNGVIGSIVTVDVVDPGSGYEFIPVSVIESATGVGAKVRAEVEQSYVTTEGRWTTSDSIISSMERKIQGQDYYVDYSYVLSSKVEFFKYKKILKELLHPVGMVDYSEYKKSQVIEGEDILVKKKNITTDEQFRTIGGRVNVGNGSIIVTGINTKFNTAAYLGIIEPVSRLTKIAVNGEIRTVNTILSNTIMLTIGEVANVAVANSGNGYVNGNLVFSNGGGTITGLSIRPGYNGSGYSNGIIVFKNVEEGIVAIANAEVYPSNGALRRVSLTSGGLYSDKPIAEPFTDPHLVFYSNTVTVTNLGRGYTKGKLIPIGGAPVRETQISFDVYSSNGSVNSSSITVSDSGLYESNVVLFPNTTPNSVVHTMSIVNNGLGHSNGTIVFNDLGIATITANAGAVGVNSWINFSNNIGIIGSSNLIAANARVFVNTTGHIMNVTMYANGVYFNPPTISNVYTSLIYAENTASIATSSYTNAVFTIATLRYSNQPTVVTAEVYPSNGSIRSVTIKDKGLYANSLRVTSITANDGSVAVNSWINLDGYLGYNTSSNSVNARIFVNTTGHIENVTIYANGFYRSIPEVSNVYTNLIYYENVAPISTASYTNAVFTITTADRPTTIGQLIGVPNTWPISVTGVGPNVSVNPAITFNGASHQNGFVIFSGGNPIVNANATIEVYGSNGVIRRITVTEPGLYKTAPTATPNSVPVSITQVLPLLPSFGGTGYANGFLKIVGGGANTPANVEVFSNTAGAITRVQINRIGLYANGDNISLTPGIHTITANAGAVAVNSWISFPIGTPDASVNIANARVYVNTTGHIVNVSLFANGIYTVTPNISNVYTDLRYYENTAAISTLSYTNAVFSIVMGPVVHTYTGVTSNGNGTQFALSYNANTSNLANLIVSTTANGLHTGNVVFTANSNVLTNAVFTTAGVANTQTIAIIDVGFVETNTAAVGTVEVYPSNGSIRKVTVTSNGAYYYPPTITPKHVGGVANVTVNTGAIGVNSWINFSGDTNGPANVTNARVFVNTTGHIMNVSVYANGIYNVFSAPSISNTYTSLIYFENTSPISTGSYTNAVFTIERVGGAFSNAELTTIAGAFTQTANLQTAIFSYQPKLVYTEGGDEIETEDGIIFTTD